MTALNSARAAFFAAALISLPAAAQDAPQAAAPAAPAATPAAPSAPVSLLPATPADETPQEPSIAVGELSAPGIDRIGLVDVANGGFPPNLWKGTSADALQKLLPQLPTQIRSPAARRLAINLLLSPGVAPDSGASQWLLETRVSTLAALGDWNDALALLELVPADQMSDALTRTRVDGHLIVGKTNMACGEVQNALKVSNDVYWQKVQIFCQLVGGQGSAAGLGIGVLREQRVDDPAFFWLADALQENPHSPPDGIKTLEPLHLAMLRKAGGVVPDALLATTDPTTLGIIAALPLADQTPNPADKTPAAVKKERLRLATEARILMAERAVALGVLDPDVLRALYRQWDSKLDPNPPSLTKLTADDVRARAMLFQSALLQTVPAARAEVIQRAVDLARTDHGEKGVDLAIVGLVYTPMIAEIPTSTDMLWFAAPAARALYAAGETEQGKKWLDFLRNMTRSNSDAVREYDCVAPADHIMTGVTPAVIAKDDLRCWDAPLPGSTPPPVPAPGTRDVAVNFLTAVGYEADVGVFTQAGAFPPQKPEPAMSPALWNALSAAAQAKRSGEVAVLALIAIGDGTLEDLPALSAHHVVESLIAAGRVTDGRAIAVEAAFEAGL